jgi:hypothetical protein
MTNLYHEYGSKFIPFRFKAEQAERTRSSIGGEPPAGILPPRVYPQTRYLGTLGLKEDLDVSMFTTFEYSPPPSAFNLWSATGRLQDASSELVQFVVHPAWLARATGSPLRGDLIETLGFEFGSPAFDPKCSVTDFGQVPIYEGHKVGGLPYFDQLEGDFEAAFGLLDKGFIHLLQLNFPSREDDPIPIDWFFGENPFHVFARKNRDVFEFRYIWR